MNPEGEGFGRKRQSTRNVGIRVSLTTQQGLAGKGTCGRVGSEKHSGAVVHAEEHVRVRHVGSHDDEALQVGVRRQQLPQLQRLGQRAHPPQQPHLRRAHLHHAPYI